MAGCRIHGGLEWNEDGRLAVKFPLAQVTHDPMLTAMRRFKYVGARKNWAAFGLLSPGDEVQMTFSQSLEIEDSDEFELIPSRKRPHDVVALSGAPSYDLRRVKWDSSTLPNSLHAQSLSTLVLLATACHEIGCDVVVTDQDSKGDIAEKILELAHLNGWIGLDENQRLACPSFDSEASVEANDESDEPETEGEDEGEDGSEDEDGVSVNVGDRAREEDGTFKADDPATDGVNEAYVEGSPMRTAKKAAKKVAAKKAARRN